RPGWLHAPRQPTAPIRCGGAPNAPVAGRWPARRKGWKPRDARSCGGLLHAGEGVVERLDQAGWPVLAPHAEACVEAERAHEQVATVAKMSFGRIAVHPLAQVAMQGDGVDQRL